MDKYTMDELQYKNGVADGFEKGKREADARNQPKSPYNDDNVLACPRCGSVEYLHNDSEIPNRFCGNCGQALDWRVRWVKP